MLGRAVIALALAGVAGAEQIVKGSWDQVSRLHPGQRVELRTRSNGKISGKVASVSAGSIEVRSKDRLVSTPAGEVRRIRARSLKRRFRNAGIVAAAGAGAGALLGTAANRASYNDRFRIIEPRDVVVAVSAAMAVVAFGIGMIPPGKRTVYEVR